MWYSAHKGQIIPGEIAVISYYIGGMQFAVVQVLVTLVLGKTFLYLVEYTPRKVHAVLEPKEAEHNT